MLSGFLIAIVTYSEPLRNHIYTCIGFTLILFTLLAHVKREINMSKGDAVMVVVRVRPLSRREIDMNTEVCIDMKGKQVLLAAANKQQQKNYSFDHCFWSIDPGNPKFTGQVDVFNALGENFLKNSFQGYNGCVFAYGQTGSGKSYTMMGPPSGEEERGLIPRLCDALFSRIETQAADRPDIASTVEVVPASPSSVCVYLYYPM